MSQEHLEQVSLKIERSLRAELERAAAAECRSLSAQIRYLVIRGMANGATRQQSSEAA
jgi:hypothetical protein